MARCGRAVELAMIDEEIERLTVISRSRTEPASRVERAQMLLTYRDDPSSLEWDKNLAFITKRSNVVSNGRWPMAR